MNPSLNGFVRLDRGFFDHWIWSEKRVYSRAEAWLDLIAMCAYEPHKRMIAGELVEIPRGAVVASERFLSTRWEWSRTKVRAFLSVLSDDGMVKIEAGKKDQQNTTIYLCNFEKHNPKKDQQKTGEEPVKGQQRTTERPLKDQIEEDKEGKDDQDDKEMKELFPPSKAKASEVPGSFDTFWTHYPRKVEKMRAMRAWKTAKIDGKGLLPTVLAGLAKWKASAQWQDPQFIPHPAKWISNEYWDSEPVQPATGTAKDKALDEQYAVTPEQMAEWTQNRIDRENELKERAAAKARGEKWEEKSDF